MIRFLTNRAVQVGILLALLLAATWFSGTESPLLSRLQYGTFDTFNKIMPRTPADGVTIVDIDEDSIAQLGQWPWPRDVMGRLIDQLKAQGALAIAFDIVFAEEDRTDPALFASKLPDVPETQAARTLLSTMPDNDTLFADSIRKAGNVVTGFVWSSRGNAGKVPATPRGMVLSSQAQSMLMEKAATARHIVTSLPVLQEAAAGNGSFSVSTDIDGIVRRVPLVVKFAPEGGTPQLYPSLALETLRVGMGDKASIQITQARQQSLGDLFKPSLQIKIGSVRIPVNDDGQLWIYYTPVQKDRYVSAASVINGTAPADKIAGHIVMVGTSAEGLKDIRSSPLNLFIPGVEMHVNIIEQALQGKFISRPALVRGIEGVFIFVTGLLVILLTPFVNVFLLLGVVIALIAGAFGLSWHGYTDLGVMIDPVYPSLAVLVMFVVSALLSYLRAETERQEIRGAFGLYISPDFMKELTANPDKLKLGGEIKDLTVMFTDIRNFTTIAEGMSPQVLINTMNDFLTPMSDEVMKARGTIDKYMGDAMMAFWNAPLDVENHERLAVEAALRMREVLAPVNEKLKVQAEAEGRKFHPLNCGIGVNSGPVAVGNMGSRQRFAYSVLGDTVNLASRLEGQTKAYGVTLLISESTAQKVDDFALMELDLIKVKGKERPVRIYTVLGAADMARDGTFAAWQGKHTQFLEAYRQGDFDSARIHISACRGFDAQGRMADYYTMMEGRLVDFATTPPSHDWDGVYEAKTK